MASKNPYDKLFEQVADLLVMLNKNQGKILGEEGLPEGVEKQLEDLENDINLFKKITDEAIKKSGISDEEIFTKLQNTKEIRDRKDKRAIERSKKLMVELKSMENNLSGYVRAIKMGTKRLGNKGRKRKSKFKRLGGDDKGWMPL